MLRKKGRTLLALSVMLMICALSVRAEEVEKGTYTVRRGDTLWHISGTYLQDPRLWPKIWEKNKYIKNPHLIYPGDPIAIPGREEGAPEGAPSEKEAAMAPEAAPQEELAVSGEVTKEEGVPKAEEAAAPEKEEPSPAEVSAPSRLELPPYRPAPVATPQIIADSGFIGKEDILRESKRIIKPLDPIKELSAGDPVIVNLGLRDYVKPGDRFSILRPTRKIHHPYKRGRLGVLVLNVGWLEIKEVVGNSSKAEIGYSYIPVWVGDRLVPYKVSPFPTDSQPQPTAMQVKGCIVACREEKMIGQQDIIYIDLGAKQAIGPGDVFSISRPDILPRGAVPKGAQPTSTRMGELVVLRTGEETSSALVLKSYGEIARGDRITLEKKIP